MARHHFTTVLDEFGIKKSDDYRKLAPDHRHYFEESFFKSLNKEISSTLNDLRDAGGVKLHFKTGSGARNIPTNAFLAKSAFYANKTLITYPFRNIEDKRDLEEFKNKHKSAREVNRAHRIYVAGPPSRSKKEEGYKIDVAEFEAFLDLLISHRPAIESGVANILPSFPDTEKKVRNKNLALISANFSSRELHKQFFELPDSGIVKRESSPIILLLPHFGNISIEKVLEIREKENDLYGEFQHTFKTLLDTSPRDSESVILKQMRDVDEGVKALNRKSREIQRGYWRKNYTITIGTLLINLVPLISRGVEIDRISSVILGAAFQAFTARKEYRAQLSSLRDNQFYMHWRLSKAAGSERSVIERLL